MFYDILCSSSLQVILLITIMIRSIAIAAIGVVGSASASLAGPYANIEANSGFIGSNYVGTVTDFHVGYEDALGEAASYYIQGGPAIVAPDGGDQDTELSGKIGISADVTDKLGVYGELSFITDGSDDAGYGSKAGVKYSF